MSLRYKTAILIISLFLVVTITEFFVLRYFVYSAFLSLERDDADDDMTRITQAFKNEINHLNNLNNDWATWDDTYDFVQNRSEEYIESNLPDHVFYEAGLNLIYIVDNDNKVVWGKIYDRYRKEETTIKEIPKDLFPENHPLLIRDYREHTLPTVKKTGIFNTEKGPLLISTELILTSKGKGPSMGFMIMGKSIDNNFIKRIEEQTKESFEIIYLYNNPDVEPYKEIIKGLEETKLYIQENPQDKSIYNLYKFYSDIEENPSMIIKADFPRDVSAQGRKVITFATLCLIITGILVLLLIILLLNRYAIRPLYTLDKHMFEIIKNNDFSIRINSARKDEIGDLSQAFDFFIGKVEKQKKLLEELSTIDGLTKIANRRKFDETIKLEWARHKRFKSQISILLLDVDYFKKYNDFYGHQAGDRCLEKIGSLLSSKTKRAGELAARYGGEEFVIIYCNCNEEDVLKVCESIKSDLEKLSIVHEKSDIAKHVTMSIGVAICVPDIDSEYSELVSMADEALYQAKREGRNRSVLFHVAHK